MNRLNLGPRFNWTLENGDTLAWESLATGSSFRNHGHAMTTTLIGAPPTSPDLHTFGEFDDRMLKSDLRWNRKTAAGTELDVKFGAEVVDAQDVRAGASASMARAGRRPTGIRCPTPMRAA